MISYTDKPLLKRAVVREINPEVLDSNLYSLTVTRNFSQIKRSQTLRNATERGIVSSVNK